jgi:hypothetical protein
MDDATFLNQCGIEPDMRWLAEISRDQSADVPYYAGSLFGAANMLARI